jgi:hypothetical protein
MVFLSLILISIIACDLTPSSPSSPVQGTPFAPTQLPEGNDQESPNQSSNFEFISFYPQVSEPENGWKNYSAVLAFHNNNNTSVQIYQNNISHSAIDKSLPTIVISVGNSYVETQEGETYPATFGQQGSVFGSLIIPPEILILGFPNPIIYDFRVPEKLSPSNLVISPGIAFIPSAELVNYINNNLPLQFVETSVEIFGNQAEPIMPNENAGIHDPQSQEVMLNENVVASIPGDFSAKLTSDFGNSNLNIELSIPVTNKDITQDSEFSVDVLLVDQYGYQYYGTYCSGNYLDKLGPGQSDEFKRCFSLPVYSANLPRDFLLSYYWNKQEITYNVKINDLVNCESLSLDSIFADGGRDISQGGYHGSRQEISVPEEKTVYTNYDSASANDLWTLNVQPNREIIVRLPPGPNSQASLQFLVGPDGFVFPATDLSVYGEAGGSFSFYSYCDGPYYFIVWVGFFESSYTIITEMR